MKEKENLRYLIRRNIPDQLKEYYIYDIQIFREYGDERKYYSQILRFDMQNNRPETFLTAYGFSIDSIDLHHLDTCTKFLKLIRISMYGHASRTVLAAFKKMKIKKVLPDEVFNRR